MKLIRLLFAVIALCLAQPARAQITDQQAIDYVKNAWELTDLTDSAISQTLNSSYSGIPFKDYVSFFFAAPDVLNPLAKGDYKTAGKKAADFAVNQLFDSLLEQAGLDGVVGPARLASWPIEHQLNAFYQAVAAASFKQQMALYFEAREGDKNSPSEIVNLQPGDLLNGVLISKSDDGWLFKTLSYLYGSVPNYTPAQFFEYAEIMWQADQARARYDADQLVVRDAFRAAASPQKPVITQQPQDRVISSGQSFTFTVTASGTGPFNYVWRFNGGVILLATSASYQANAAGEYQVSVGNGAGSTPSRVATLTVNFGEPTAITAPAANATVSGNVIVRATANAATKVEFYLDGYRQTTDSSAPFAWTWDSTTFPNGSHALTAKAFNGSTALGASAVVSLTVNNSTPPSSPPSIASVFPSTLTALPLPQTQLLRIFGSGFTVSSTLLFNGSIASDPARLYFINASEIDYYVRTDTNAANWTVKVINGAQQSNLGYFTVVNSPPNTGSLTVNLSPVGAISAGAQWRVDGGAYHNSGDVVSSLTPGSHTVSFKPVGSYSAPASQSANILANQQTTLNIGYTPVAPSTYTLTLNSAGAQGYIINQPFGSGGGNIYSAGTVVQLTAIANPGYHFVGWSGSVNGTANPTPLVMDANKNVSANFVSGDDRLGTITVTIQPSGAVAAGVKWGWNESDFRNSGTSYTTFPGNYFIVLHPVDGWFGPSLFPVTVTAGQTTPYTVTFNQDTTPGLLTVTLSPPDAVTAGAHWRVNGGAAQGNGATVSLPPGPNYSVTFDSVSGWTAPPNQTVQVQRAQTTVVSGNYTPPVGQPVIAAVHPSFGALAGGTALTIEGVNFTAPATVLVGGRAATNVSVLSGSQIVCLTPSNSVYGTVPVVVQTPTGNATNANGFTYGVERGNGIELVSAIGGEATAVAVQGNYAYIGEGSSFVVADVSNPASPLPVGRLAMPGMMQDVAVSGQYAFVANNDAGLQVVDVSTPSAPKLVGFYDTPGISEGVAISGTNAFVADGDGGLFIFDITIPKSPVLLASTNLGGFAQDVAVSGNFAYVLAGGNLVIVDATNPRSPRPRAQLSLPYSVMNCLAVSGSRVFVAAWDAGLKMIDISNPDAPSNLGSAPSISFPLSVATSGNLVFTAGSTAFAVSSFSGGTITFLGKNNGIVSGGYNLAASGNRVYMPAGANGFSIVDASTPASPTLSGSLSALSGDYGSTALAGNLAYVFVAHGYKAFNIANPALPVLVGQYAGLNGGAGQILATNGIAYINGQGAETKILDVANPAAPTVLNTIPVATIYANKLALSGNTLFIAGLDTMDNGKFIAFDVSTPSSPTQRGQLSFPSINQSVLSLAVKGNKAVIGLNSGELKILDVSNVNSPSVLGGLSGTNAMSDVAMSADGHYAFIVARRGNAFRVVDITSPASPVEIAYIPLAAPPFSLCARDNLVYVIGADGVLVFDLSIPASPVLMRSYAAPSSVSGFGYGIAVERDSVHDRDTIYAGDFIAGLVVLQTKDKQIPNTQITGPTAAPTYTNTTGSLNLAGVASDNIGVTRVTWSNDRGGAGDATGTTNWFANGISLQPGTNILTVTAFDQTGNSSNNTLTVVYQSPKQSQTITFPALANKTFGDAPVPLAAAASSGLAVGFTFVSGPAVLSNNMLTLTGAGSVIVRATQLGDAQFNAAPAVTNSFNVVKGDQAITFALVPDKMLGDGPFPVDATASSGLPVVFSIVSGPATVSGNVVTLTSAGAVTVRASQYGNANFNAALDVERSFIVAKLPQFIAFAALNRQVNGDAPFALSAVASSGLTVSFSLLSGPAIVSGNNVTIIGPGLVMLRASQAGDANYAPAPSADQVLVVAPGSNLMTDSQRLANGMFTFRFYGEPGTNYVVQGSTNLANWSPLATNQVSGLGYLEFIDTVATNYDKRFYQVEQK